MGPNPLPETVSTTTSVIALTELTSPELQPVQQENFIVGMSEVNLSLYFHLALMIDFVIAVMEVMNMMVVSIVPTHVSWVGILST